MCRRWRRPSCSVLVAFEIVLSVDVETKICDCYDNDGDVDASIESLK